MHTAGIRDEAFADSMCILSGIGFGACVIGDGFHALHWNVLSWL